MRTFDKPENNKNTRGKVIEMNKITNMENIDTLKISETAFSMIKDWKLLNTDLILGFKPEIKECGLEIEGNGKYYFKEIDENCHYYEFHNNSGIMFFKIYMTRDVSGYMVVNDFWVNPMVLEEFEKLNRVTRNISTKVLNEVAKTERFLLTACMVFVENFKSQMIIEEELINMTNSERRKIKRHNAENPDNQIKMKKTIIKVPDKIDIFKQEKDIKIISYMQDMLPHAKIEMSRTAAGNMFRAIEENGIDILGDCKRVIEQGLLIVDDSEEVFFAFLNTKDTLYEYHKCGQLVFKALIRNKGKEEYEIVGRQIEKKSDNVSIEYYDNLLHHVIILVAVCMRYIEHYQDKIESNLEEVELTSEIERIIGRKKPDNLIITRKHFVIPDTIDLSDYARRVNK